MVRVPLLLFYSLRAPGQMGAGILHISSLTVRHPTQPPAAPTLSAIPTSHQSYLYMSHTHHPLATPTSHHFTYLVSHSHHSPVIPTTHQSRPPPISHAHHPSVTSTTHQSRPPPISHAQHPSVTPTNYHTHTPPVSVYMSLTACVANSLTGSPDSPPTSSRCPLRKEDGLAIVVLQTMRPSTPEDGPHTTAAMSLLSSCERSGASLMSSGGRVRRVSRAAVTWANKKLLLKQYSTKPHELQRLADEGGGSGVDGEEME